MQVVVSHASVPAKGYESVSGPRKVVAWVVLHWQPDVNHVKGKDGEWMTLQYRDVQHVEEGQRKQLPDAHILRGQRKGGRVLVMHLVEGSVQPGHLMMQQVPREDLGVEEQQADQDVTQELQKLRSLLWQECRATRPV